MEYNIRRQLYDRSSLASEPMPNLWQWEGDRGQWICYPLLVAALLEQAQRDRVTTVDLDRPPYNLPYVVQLTTMTQIRGGSGYRRRVRRTIDSIGYARVMVSNPSVTGTGAPWSQPGNQYSRETSDQNARSSGATAVCWQGFGSPSTNPATSQSFDFQGNRQSQDTFVFGTHGNADSSSNSGYPPPSQRSRTGNSVPAPSKRERKLKKSSE